MFETATNASSTPIVPQDRFIAECTNLEEVPPYAPPGEQPKQGARPGVRWTLALYDPNTGQRFTFQDEPYEFWQTTTSNMQKGARAREYAEAFLGRELKEGEMLSPNMLLGRRCLGMVIHELSRDKTKKSAKLVAVEPLKSAPAPVVPASASAAQISADATDAEIDRALLISKLEKKIASAVKLGTPSHLTWAAFTAEDFRTGDTALLEQLLIDATAEVKTALED